jgi:hypothetical protein
MPKTVVVRNAVRPAGYRSLERMEEQTRILYEHLAAERKRVNSMRSKPKDRTK